MTVSRSRLLWPALLVLAAGCASDAPSDSSDEGGATGESGTNGTAFPFDGTEDGKTDVFGRSLVGAPNAYQPDPTLLSDPAAADQRLNTDLRLRRETAWEIARKVLEPVPLLGLASQLDARPDCAEGVSDRDLDRCARLGDEGACTDQKSGDVGGICTWDASNGRCGPSCDNLSLPDGSAIPTVPRWATWYGVEDINRIFQEAYGQLTPEEQVDRKAFTDLQIGRAFQANNTELDRSKRWPLRRYTDAVTDLFGCELTRGAEESEEDYEARCALARQSQFSGGATPGGGIARLVYSPAMVLHMMRNYGEVLDCADDPLTETWCSGTECEDRPGNFSTCFRSEFPADGGNPWRDLDPAEAGDVAGLPAVGGTVVIKATWTRVGFGFDLPAFDTSAEALQRKVGPGEQALWPEDGDRQYPSGTDANAPLVPSADEIYTISTRKGSVYRLTGLHIMTKELRHWVWITLWWSDDPDSDFGADRPASFGELPSPWSNYKMCVATDYIEGDADPLARYGDFPSLQAALAATGHATGAPTWCSNPYIEHGAGNARTNCIGCHQHAGTREYADGSDFDLESVIANENPTPNASNPHPANGRIRQRSVFATDYSWAFSRLDDLTNLIRKEVEFRGAQDERWVRIDSILDTEGDPEAGQALFAETTDGQACADCHGAQGEGGFGPPLEGRFASKTEWELVNTILEGRGNMPAWGDQLADSEIIDLMAWLRAEFSPAK
ncbi:MAG: c-type cytochrome [Planctomycetota bacterium]|jgi:mono/diheme cytochrome c family protein